MAPADSPVLRDVVLIGGGHSHVGVLRMFGMDPWPGVRLTVICTDVDTPYSGMLPGYVAGHYTHADVHIDLQRLCAFAGARFYQDEVIGIDRANRKVLCKNRPPVPYDALSINVGSTPQVRLTEGIDAVVPVKPIAGFNARWLALLQRVQQAQTPLRIAVVGGGAGGVELLLAMQHRLQREWQDRGRDRKDLQFHLLTAGNTILPTHNRWVQQRFLNVLQQRGVHLHCNADVDRVVNGVVHTRGGLQVPADEVMWVTQAGGAAWLRSTGLKLDDSGFIQVGPTLQTLDDPAIFAAGDVASLVESPLEKAGVFAVRMGKPLARNLRRFLQGEALAAYHPQRTWLALISTGDQHAIASKGALGFAGDWVWQWKDWIDRRFMRKFTEFPAMRAAASGAAASGAAASGAGRGVFGTGGTGAGGAGSDRRSGTGLALNDEEAQQAISAIAMRCGGCGAKVGATVLSRALGNLRPIERDDVLVGLHAPDDAAIVRVPPGKAMVHTVDFFRAFVDDPYVFGRVAANHALGDIFAMGGEPQSATAVVTVPPGLESKTEDLLFQMMSGAVDVLNAAGCALVGGHTGEGKELALGFAINGLIDETLQSAMIKGGLRPGDAIILTKPVGTGTLFAALPQSKARGVWIQAALRQMQVSNQAGARCLQAHGAKACTDLTGFGLLGHLVEMTKPSEVDVELDLDSIPWLDGAVDCVRAGVFSSLQPANVRLRRAIRNPDLYVNDPRYALLFDPQTAGGLLASVPGERARDCIQALHVLGYSSACVIGRVVKPGEALEPVVLTGKPMNSGD